MTDGYIVLAPLVLGGKPRLGLLKYHGPKTFEFIPLNHQTRDLDQPGKLHFHESADLKVIPSIDAAVVRLEILMKVWDEHQPFVEAARRNLDDDRYKTRKYGSYIIPEILTLNVNKANDELKEALRKQFQAVVDKHAEY